MCLEEGIDYPLIKATTAESVDSLVGIRLTDVDALVLSPRDQTAQEHFSIRLCT
jgi:hypothetical protein